MNLPDLFCTRPNVILFLQHVGVFDVADRIFRLVHEGGHALVAPAAGPDRPFDRGALADPGAPFGARFGEIVDEVKCRARAIRTVHDLDRRVGQPEIRIDPGDGGVVPILDLAEIDVGEQWTGELDLARLDPLDIHHRHDAAITSGLCHADLAQFGWLERRIRRAEIQRRVFDLRDARGRADRLIVHPDALARAVLGRHFDRIGNTKVEPAPVISAAFTGPARARA
jgi:hypothetical protein